jgi:hypothetical protein
MLLHTKKHQGSLSPEEKAQILKNDAAAPKKYELLSSKKKQDLWKPRLII